MSDVREIVAVEEAQKQQKEVEQLRQTVETLKMALPS